MRQPREQILQLFNGDCFEVLKGLADNSIDAVVTDPPYGLNSKEPDMAEVLKHWLAGDDAPVKGSGFMGKAWDKFVPGPAVWREVFRVLKPGGHLLSFFGSRTYDMGALAIRLAGFEIRDQIMWVYGSGFPKSLNIAKQIDKHGGEDISWFGPWFREWRKSKGLSSNMVAALFPSATGGITGCVRNWELGLNLPTPEQFNVLCCKFGLPFDSILQARREIVGQVKTPLLAIAPGQNHARPAAFLDITSAGSEAAKEWEGWGTALKPAHEPICVARKPLAGTVAANILAHGTGGLNIEGCRVRLAEGEAPYNYRNGPGGSDPNHMWRGEAKGGGEEAKEGNPQGRWPANLVHDGSDEVLAAFPDAKGQQGALTGDVPSGKMGSANCYGKMDRRHEAVPRIDSSKSAARFFYCAKASKADRNYGLSGDEHTSADLVGREEGSAGTQSPRAGAGRTTGSKNPHPTVKPVALMRWLVRLVTPPGGRVLDPFMGSGSTGVATALEGFRFTGIELDPVFHAVASERIYFARKEYFLEKDRNDQPAVEV